MFKFFNKHLNGLQKNPTKPCPKCKKTMVQRESSMGQTFICPMCGFSEDTR